MSEPPARVLVVDDDDVKRYTITHTLRRAGFEVVEAGLGADALRLTATATLLVLDVKLPDLDGFEVCRKLKADPATAHVPVLLLSATFVGSESQVRGLESGADAYLTNATEPPVLIATAKALIRMRRAEEQARRDEARLRIALEAGGLGEWNLDIATGALTCSARCKAILGRAPDEPCALADFDAAIHPDDRAPEAATRGRAIDQGAGYDAEFRVVRPSGEVRWVLMRGQAVGTGADRHLIGVALDITERKRAEEALREADRQKDEFLALLAHELRNPLAPLRTALELECQPNAPPATVARARDTMARQLSSMVRLIDDLLDVSRISKGKIQLHTERVQLSAVIESAIETSRPLIETHRHEFTVDLPREPVWLDADPIRLAQVVSNLLNNAAKYTPDGGRISLSAATAAGRCGPVVEIRVADNGIGIPPDALPRMWEMFAQADRTQARSQGGLGIGLTLVKRLVELHRGTVHSRSEGTGRGSEFTVVLPVTTGPVEQPVAAPAAASRATGRRVLVVDDNVDGLESLATLLEMTGYVVRTAADGPGALAEAEAFQPDVIVTDIGLPGMDGYEVARRLRANPAFRQTRLIALTGWGQDADRERARAAGFDHHLVKPVNPAELRRLL